MIRMKVGTSALLFCCAANLGAATSARSGQPIETVTVVGVAPVPDRGLSLELVPANVQVVTAKQLERLNALDLTQYLNRSAGSVFINEAQSNPLQPDVQFRGFTASPLLGLPQGIAVYQEGVRVNEPFGDTVNWALLPEVAIASLTLMPGSNPLFGMNALGGAFQLRTRNGFTHQGVHAEAQVGSFSRATAQAQFGGALNQHVAGYIGGSWFDEDGWRDYSPSRAAQIFADLRYQGDAGSLGLSLTQVSTNLIGNGPAPVQLLEQDREAIFTRPDRTQNDLLMLNLNTSYQLGAATSLNSVVYHRRSDIDTLNGDDSPFEQCNDDARLLCEEQGEVVHDTRGNPVEYGADNSGATLNRSATDQESYGASLQLTTQGRLAGRINHFTAGMSYDRGNVGFHSSTELGALDETRAAVPAGVFAQEAFVDLRTTTASYGAYFTDTLEITSAVSVNVAGRYSIIDVELHDRLGTELNGSHRFSRFNPAAGITWRPSAAMQFYASIGESNRAPSPAELTCADEDDPCRLPNAFLSDPPLAQVVSRTIEAGVRGAAGTTSWHLGVFRTVNRDDILFISAGALTNEGFFDNVGKTRRQGIELSLHGTRLSDRLAWFANYTFLSATFQDSFTVASANNPAAIDDEIPVAAGDRIPGVPENLLKLGVDYALSSRWSLGADFNHASSQYLRGDEGNLTAPAAAYSVLNLRASLAATDQLSLFVTIENALNEPYESFGLFGEPDEVLGEDYDDPRFVSPGASRAAWVGFKLAL